jgi:hypothetical protein
VDEIISDAYDAWNDFIAQPGLIKSMCSVEWAKL